MIAYNAGVTFERLPETVQTLYAELLDQTIQARAEMEGMPEAGSFVSKQIRGRTYWYLQRLEGQRKRQIYLGAESPSLLQWMRDVGERRKLIEPDVERRRELVSMLISGGAPAPGPSIAQVIQVLADAKLFEVGAMLVGTQAFGSYGNMLGVRLQGAHQRTEDIDIAHDPVVELSIAEQFARTDLLEKLREAEPRFFAVPALDPRRPSTSFKIRGRDLRVDFLTPGNEGGAAVNLPSFEVAAVPLPHLDYLMERPEQAVILTGSGVLVEVPSPERFALHKLWASQQRPISERTKTRKDVAQASFLLEILLEDNLHELSNAWNATRYRRGMRKGIRAALDSAPDTISKRIGDL